MTAGGSRGVTLVSVMVAVAILAIALTMSTSAFIGASRLTQRATHLSAASDFAQGVMEQVIARGFEQARTMQVANGLPKLDGFRCQIEVTQAVVGLKQVLVTASWQEEGRARSVRLSTLLAKRRAR